MKPPKSILTISVVEAYMDKVFDLLNNRKVVSTAGVGSKPVRGGNQDFGAQFDTNGKWVPPTRWGKSSVQQRDESKAESIDGVATIVVECEEDVAKVSRLIEATRSAQAHYLNDRSSRSHCLLTLELEVLDAQGYIVKSSLTVADLAGSERIDMSGVSGDARGGATSFSLKGHASIYIRASRVDEARNVNTSLAALSRLMVGLGSGDEYLPFRDSALNTLLKPTFASGSGCRAQLLLSLRGDTRNIKETQSTLRFGEVVAKVKSKFHGKFSLDREHRSARVARLQQQLELAMQSLEAMKGVKQHVGGVSPDADKPTIQGFLGNKAELEKMESDQRTYKQLLSELKARGGSTMAKPGSSSSHPPRHDAGEEEEVLRIQKALLVCQERIPILTGIVARQINAGIYMPPSQRFVACKLQIETLTKQLQNFQ